MTWISLVSHLLVLIVVSSICLVLELTLVLSLVEEPLVIVLILLISLLMGCILHLGLDVLTNVTHYELLLKIIRTLSFVMELLLVVVIKLCLLQELIWMVLASWCEVAGSCSVAKTLAL